MPNWIALTRLTGADEYGKRSIVAMTKEKRSGLPSTLVRCFLTLLVCSCLRCHKCSGACTRACAGHALPQREKENGQALGANREMPCFFSSLSCASLLSAALEVISRLSLIENATKKIRRTQQAR